ncbi:MAG TPA: class F sortase [Actinomycetota bacterium]|nr:class F sortase [Actinomycetota bacterium]
MATPIWWVVSRPHIEAGTVPATGAAPRAAPVLDQKGVLTLAKVAVRSARLSDQAVSEVVPPVRLGIPALGVDASIVPVGVEPHGGMEVPEDVRTAGWYRFGPLPGAQGSAMVIGHVDSRVQGPGVFFGLSKLRLGERIGVQLADGPTQYFVAVARRFFAKDELPQDLFARDGPPRLTLVTCGGGFDERARSYTHNVIVYAVPETEA